MNKDKIYIEMVYKLNAVPTNIMAEKIITMQPIILLINKIPDVSNFPLIWSINHVSPNHYKSAPKKMQK